MSTPPSSLELHPNLQNLALKTISLGSKEESNFIPLTTPLEIEIRDITNTGWKFIQDALHLTRSIGPYDGCDRAEKLSNEHFRRSANQIWESRYSLSCTDWAELYAYIANLKGYPTLMVQMIDLNSPHDEEFYNSKGHVFCFSQIGEDYYLVNPTSGNYTKIDDLDSDINFYISLMDMDKTRRNWAIVASGKDSKSTGIKSHQDMLEKMKLMASEYNDKVIKPTEEVPWLSQ